MARSSDVGMTNGAVRLPVSGRAVTLRRATGHEDLLLLESPAADAGVRLAERLATPADAVPIDWSALSVTDLDALILQIRRLVVGDTIRADVACRAPGCGKRVDVSFGIGAYLAHHAPSPPRGRGWRAVPATDANWFRLVEDRPAEPADVDVRFRLPTAGDRVAVAGHADAAGELARRCIRPADAPARTRRRVEAAMEALAPALSRELDASCPECGAAVEVYFDAATFCLSELRDRAAFVYPDVDVLARRYHWSETQILALPNVRRVNYAELARQEGAS